MKLTETKHHMANTPAEQALADEDTWRRILVDQSQDGIVILDQDGKVYESNKKFAEMLGYSSEEVRQLSVFDWEYLYPRQQLLEMLRTVDEAGDHFETQHRRKDGSTYDVDISTNAATFAGQKLIFCVCRDITRRNQMKELFETVTNSSPVGIYIVQDKRFILANPQFQKLTGYSEEELLGMNSLSLVLPEDRQAVREKAVRMLKGRRSSPYQFRVMHKSGKLRWVMETVTSIQYRGRRAILGNYIDITKRRKTEEKVRQQNEFLNNILNSLNHPFYVLNAKDYTIKMGNLATRAGDLSKKPTCYALIHKRDRPCQGIDHACPLEEVKKTKQPVVMEHIHYDDDGNAKNIEVHGYPIFDADGNVVQMIEYCLDVTERKRAEEALRESEEFRSSMLANSPNPIGVINPDSSIRYVNPALEKLTGFSAAELIGKKAPYPYWAPESLRKTIIGFRKAMRQGDQRAEELFRRKNGERFWVKITATPVINNGEFKYLLTNWVDITKRKQAEEALRESEKKYKSLVEATGDIIWEVDEKGFFTFVSPKIKDLLGYEAKEVIGKIKTLDLVPRAEASLWLKRFREINAKREPIFGFEITHLHKNGSPVLFEISGIPTFYSSGNFKGYMGINKNITERKRAEEELRESQRFSSNLLESAPNPIFVTNPDTSLRYVNPAFEKLTGFTYEELIGKRAPYPWWPEELGRKMTADFENAMATGGRKSEKGFQKKNGELFWVALNSTPIMHEGKLIYFLVNWVDVTERKRMEEQLMLTDRLASIGELASGIAHELNNPLTSVIGFSQLLLEEDIPENLKEDLHTIYSEAQRASAIVKNLLTFARKHSPLRQLSQINNILEDVLKLRAYEHKVNNIEVEKQFAEDLPEVMIDYFQMQQVFLNVIVNAESAMLEANGRGKMSITTSQYNNYVRVVIADNGPGITKENLRRVFDPFFTTKEVGKGTGLGLSICHGIVTGHGGQIYAESKVSKGATFVVELPLDGSPGGRRGRYVKR